MSSGVVTSGDGVPPCKVNYDPTTAKEMLLMAATFEDQQLWVGRLLKRIQKSGFKAAESSGQRISPQESMRSIYRSSGGTGLTASVSSASASSAAAAIHREKASTLPVNTSSSKK